MLLNDIFLISFVCLALRRLTWARSRVLLAKWPVSSYGSFPPLGRTNDMHFYSHTGLQGYTSVLFIAPTPSSSQPGPLPLIYLLFYFFRLICYLTSILTMPFLSLGLLPSCLRTPKDLFQPCLQNLLIFKSLQGAEILWLGICVSTYTCI